MSTPDPRLRIGDAEREAAVHALGEHFAAGRLDRDEFDERSAVAYAARTDAELRPLFGDLPAPHPGVPRAQSGSAQRPPYAPRSRALAATGPARGGGRSRGFRLPLVPLLTIALVLMMFTGLSWPVLLIAAGLWWTSRSMAWSGGWCGSHRAAHDRMR